MAAADVTRAAEIPAARFAAGHVPDPPYPGIRPFEEHEWPIFFGRQVIVEQLLERLSRNRFVAVVGASGGGKSSLVKAGLFATLKHKHRRLGIHWQTATMRPAGSPMWSLAEALYRTLDPSPVEPAPVDAVEPYRAGLARGRHAIAAVLEEYAFPDEQNLLLLVDQFEELFRYDILGGDVEVRTFLDQLVDAVDEPPEGFYVALTMRSDFLGDCARYPRLADALNQAVYLLRRLSDAELVEAVVHPAELLGGRIEPDLLQRLIHDAQGEQDHLPLLQHALMWLWVRKREEIAEHGTPGAPVVLELADYEALGGTAGALSHHANAIYDGLGATPERRDSLQFAMQRLFQSTAELGEHGRVTRRPLHFAQLRAETSVSAADMKEVIEAFREPGRSFLMPPLPRPIEDATVIDVSHEVLIRRWDKLGGRDADKGWLKEEQTDAETWKRLYSRVQAFIRDPRRLLDSGDIDEFQDFLERRQPAPAWLQRYISDHHNIFSAETNENHIKYLLDETNELLRKSREYQKFLYERIMKHFANVDVSGRQDLEDIMTIAEIDSEDITSIPTDMIDEVQRATAARSPGWLRLIAEEVAGKRFEWAALRLIGGAQWRLADWDGARRTWERVRENGPDDIAANLALANLYERGYRAEKKPELLHASEQAIARILGRQASAAQRAEALALQGRNQKTRWRLSFEELQDVGERRRRATNRVLLRAYEAYREAYLVDLNHYWSGLAALQMGTVALDLSREEAWSDAFDDDDQTTALTRQVEALRLIISLAIEAALKRLARGDNERVWAEMSAADLGFLVEPRRQQVVQGYLDAVPRDDHFVWSAARGQLQLFASLGVRADVADEVIRAVDAQVEPPLAAAPALHAIVFAGHRVDEPGRPETRFPPTAEAWVRELHPGRPPAAAGCRLSAQGAGLGRAGRRHPVPRGL